MNNEVYNFDLLFEEDDDVDLELEQTIEIWIKNGARLFYDTTEAWNSQPDLIGIEKAIYVYKDKTTITNGLGETKYVPGIKIGDGVTRLIDQAFVGDEHDQTYIFKQMTALDTWVIQHNLDRYPSVSVVDSAGTQVYGEIIYENRNKIVIKFTAAFTGAAYLN